MERKVKVSIRNGESNQMNAMTDVEAVHRLARTLEDAEAKRLGVRLNEARNSLARRLRTSPGTLENIRRLRTKVVPSWLMNCIRAEFVSVLQTEILRLEHEINTAQQIGMDHRDDDLQAAQAQIIAAKEILRTAK